MSISINPHLKVTNQTQHNFFFVEKTVAVFLGDNLHNIKKNKAIVLKKNAQYYFWKMDHNNCQENCHSNIGLGPPILGLDIKDVNLLSI